jgi:hypothetical protein
LASREFDRSAKSFFHNLPLLAADARAIRSTERVFDSEFQASAAGGVGDIIVPFDPLKDWTSDPSLRNGRILAFLIINFHMNRQIRSNGWCAVPRSAVVFFFERFDEVLLILHDAVICEHVESPLQ